LKPFVRLLALSALGLLTPLLQAQSIGTFSCPATSGSYLPALSAPVYAFTFNVDQTENLLDATIYLDVSVLPQLLFSESGTYYQCTIVAGSQTVYFYGAINQGVSGTAMGTSAPGAPAQVYASTLLTFQELSFGGTTISVKGPLSADALAKAKAAFKASSFGIPKSSPIQ
jgi:hypothetical protein